ncbi:MAG: 16S rRNA (guanine(527)-N(7))-methyltransferase RsmG [Paludibacteraceae bacterium]|nr:16S rRNA (guanine(527)-N(7))-methyltransferase RsmG [Paludibacteraceae bacterium]
MGVDVITKYFPNLTAKQLEQFAQLEALYSEWNEKINVISRKDIGNLYEHHVLHSLGIAKALNFRAGTTVVDVGTGGGFPGIPLAILFPDVQFHLVDSIGKKIRVAEEIRKTLGLTNCTTEQSRMEDVKGKYHFVVSRAAMPMSDLVKLVRKNIGREAINSLPNGIFTLKGGDLQAELAPYRKDVTVYQLSDWFEEEFFETKQLVYLPL